MPTTRAALPAVVIVVWLCAAAWAQGSTPRPSPAGRGAATPKPAASSQPAGDANAAPVKRTRAEVEALIGQFGKAQPDWWDSTPLNYPKTLDLTRWDAPPNSGWNPNRTIGQYFWSTINENPSKWKEGCRFAHFLMTNFKDDKPNLARAMNQAAHIYGTLLGDWGRAAFWYRKAAALTPPAYGQAIGLASSYWKLGCREMALEAINKLSAFAEPTIKLLGEMGELPKALDLARRLAQVNAGGAYLAAGDACRFNGKYKEALDYYQKVAALPKPSDQRMANLLNRAKKRAAASAEAVRLFDALDLRKIPDGTYVAESVGYAGMVKVEVTVRAGRIEAVKVVEHKETQPCTALVDPPRQIIAKQSVKGIDLVTSATITSEAVVNATAKALSQGMKP